MATEQLLGSRETAELSPNEAFQGMLNYTVDAVQAHNAHGDQLHNAAAELRASLGQSGLGVVFERTESNAGCFVHLAAQRKTPVKDGNHDLRAHFVGAYCATDDFAELIQGAAKSVVDYCRYSYDPQASNKVFMGRLILCAVLIDNVLGAISYYPFQISRGREEHKQTENYLTRAACVLDGFAQQPNFRYVNHGRLQPRVEDSFISAQSSARRQISIQDDHDMLASVERRHIVIAQEQIRHFERMADWNPADENN